MPVDWSWTALVLGLVVALLLPVIGLVVRRRWLSLRGWVFDCSLRYAGTASTGGWMLGVACLAGERFEWYRVFSLSLRPRVCLARGGSQVSSTREPTSTEAASLYDQGRIAVLDGGQDQVEIALAPRDMTAFLSWIEASPPGVRYER